MKLPRIILIFTIVFLISAQVGRSELRMGGGSYNLRHEQCVKRGTLQMIASVFFFLGTRTASHEREQARGLLVARSPVSARAMLKSSLPHMRTGADHRTHLACCYTYPAVRNRHGS